MGLAAFSRLTPKTSPVSKLPHALGLSWVFVWCFLGLSFFFFFGLLSSSPLPDRILRHIHLLGRHLQEAFPDLPKPQTRVFLQPYVQQPSPAATVLPCSSSHTGPPSSWGSQRAGVSVSPRASPIAGCTRQASTWGAGGG